MSTFAVGVYAARSLAAGDLGLFALHFSAFLLVSTLSHQGLFIPLEARAAASDQPLQFARRSLSLTWIPIVLAPGVLVLGRVAAPGTVPVALGLSAAAAVALSPLQDHMRRLLHLMGRSWSAVGVSVVQAVTVGAAVFVLHGQLDPLLIPFAALASANLASLAAASGVIGWRLTREPVSGTDTRLPGARALLGSGRWLLGAQLSAAAAAFLAATAVGRLGSMEALGLADAARIVARPVLVLTTGMTAVLGPQLMRAGVTGEEKAGRRVGSLYRRTIALSVTAYVLFFGWNHGLNPLAWLVPAAYQIPLLVLATCAANGLVGSVIPARFEAIGAGRARSLMRVDLLAGGAQVASAALAGITQAFAIPLGSALFALMRRRGLRGVRSEVYRPGSDARGPGSSHALGRAVGPPLARSVPPEGASPAREPESVAAEPAEAACPVEVG
ncbi:MAG: hypothetical protein HKN73_17750 [Gemmatimonadetes bacterium]|nr:hypothetical protein [Gemmatimonadota bacterium]